jgi:hypothetical protein
MKDAPMTFVAAMMNSMAETAMDFMLQDPKNADAHSKVGFDALWRMLTRTTATTAQPRTLSP